MIESYTGRSAIDVFRWRRGSESIFNFIRIELYGERDPGVFWKRAVDEYVAVSGSPFPASVKPIVSEAVRWKELPIIDKGVERGDTEDLGRLVEEFTENEPPGGSDSELSEFHADDELSVLLDKFKKENK
jgi:hypothetical protein